MVIKLRILVNLAFNLLVDCYEILYKPKSSTLTLYFSINTITINTSYKFYFTYSFIL